MTSPLSTEQLAAVSRVVWADVGSEVELAREAVEELRSLVRRISTGDRISAGRSEGSAASAGGLGAFLTETETFCNGEAQRLVDELRQSYQQLDSAVRASPR